MLGEDKNIGKRVDLRSRLRKFMYLCSRFKREEVGFYP